ncbi:MAG: DUF1087 domain-containing protein [Chloroflexi bacterium]|nr:DUF1087 domain-containing protein [Chloroflexota bacterium]
MIIPPANVRKAAESILRLIQVAREHRQFLHNMSCQPDWHNSGCEDATAVIEEAVQTFKPEYWEKLLRDISEEAEDRVTPWPFVESLDEILDLDTWEEIGGPP